MLSSSASPPLGQFSRRIEAAVPQELLPESICHWSNLPNEIREHAYYLTFKHKPKIWLKASQMCNHITLTAFTHFHFVFLCIFCDMYVQTFELQCIICIVAHGKQDN